MEFKKIDRSNEDKLENMSDEEAKKLNTKRIFGKIMDKLGDAGGYAANIMFIMLMVKLIGTSTLTFTSMILFCISMFIMKIIAKSIADILQHDSLNIGRVFGQI